MNEIIIKTRFKEGDTVYGYYNHFWEFRINEIHIKYRSTREHQEISYYVTAVTSPDDELTFGHEFAENELYTKEELIELIKHIEGK
jgi:hypothetical protein